jgi:hypothetical protein
MLLVDLRVYDSWYCEVLTDMPLGSRLGKFRISSWVLDTREGGIAGQSIMDFKSILDRREEYSMTIYYSIPEKYDFKGVVSRHVHVTFSKN